MTETKAGRCTSRHPSEPTIRCQRPIGHNGNHRYMGFARAGVVLDVDVDLEVGDKAFISTWTAPVLSGHLVVARLFEELLDPRNDVGPQVDVAVLVREDVARALWGHDGG